MSQKKAFIVGITGGIGSGKTTVCSLFKFYGIPVLNADELGKQLMVEDAQLVQQITALFGSAAYFENGQLNRSHLSSIVFKDKKKLESLNAIVHPAVGKATANWFLQHQSAPYLINEVAILFESGAYKRVSKSLTVHAPQAVRLARVIRRDNSQKAAVLARMNNQISDSLRLSMSDYVIFNDGSQSLIKQVHRLHHLFLELGQV